MTIGIVAVASVVLASGLAAQRGTSTTSAAPALIIGASGNMTPIVANLEEDARFYADLLGLDNPPRIRRRSHADVPYPEVLKNQGTPDATIRQVNLDIPGSPWKLEVLEFTDIDRTPGSARLQDPGAMTLVLMVRDVDGLLAKLKGGHHQVITPGGQPVLLTTGATKARAVVVKAPSGHFVELQQPDPLPATPNLPAGNVIGGHIRVTIANTDATLRLYRDQLGFRPEIGAFAKEASRLALMGTAGAQYRVTSAPVPGVPQQLLEFIEFKDIDRKPQHTRIQDPGSSKIQFRPSDVPRAMEIIKAAGGTVATTGGTYMIYMGVPTVIVRDLNNIFVNMQQQPPTPPATASSR
jgi:catechol 2,3-dioxygenase-like lactoylglutathione lyase family enzyme